MNLVDWKYTKRHGIEAKFDRFPNSMVIFRPVNHYYFVYNIRWSSLDEVVTRGNLENMELALNRALGMEKSYLKRTSCNHTLKKGFDIS